MKDFLPCLPERYLDKVVGSDEPYKAMVAITAAKLAQGIDRIARAETILDVGDANARMPGHGLRTRHPVC